VRTTLRARGGWTSSAWDWGADIGDRKHLGLPLKDFEIAVGGLPRSDGGRRTLDGALSGPTAALQCNANKLYCAALRCTVLCLISPLSVALAQWALRWLKHVASPHPRGGSSHRRPARHIADMAIGHNRQTPSYSTSCTKAMGRASRTPGCCCYCGIDLLPLHGRMSPVALYCDWVAGCACFSRRR
jgi:hypothetical protein